jgi:hypothetical protein
MKDKELSKRQMRWVQKFADFNFKIMYQSDKQNIKITALTHWADVVLRDSEDECIHYQWIIILTSNRMKIADLNKLIASSWVIEIVSSSRLVKTWFKSEFLIQVFKSSQRVEIEYRLEILDLTRQDMKIDR